MPKKTKTAFSLVELSIVILIVSILITGSLGISKTAINNTKVQNTKEKMDKVYKALTNFVAINRRLPCPALLTISKGTSGYGNETGAGTGTCTGLTPNGNTVYGMIPITALGLEPDMAEDGFGTKFSYVVDQRFTKQSTSTESTDGFEMTKSVKAEDGLAISPTLIRVQGPSGSDILPDLNALFVLISHGANKNSGWNATGTAQNPAGGIADETNNSAASFDSTFIAYSTDPNFDDILLFANKPKIVRDAGLEFMMCNKGEAATASKTWTVNGNYGCSVCSSTANNQKTCGKYGVWSALSTLTCAVNTSTCVGTSNVSETQIGQISSTTGGAGVKTYTTYVGTQWATSSTRVFCNAHEFQNALGGGFFEVKDAIVDGSGNLQVRAKTDYSTSIDVKIDYLLVR
jgi:prepilin-type N-terminal cleavage/methylation domain-containing protein